MSNGDEGECGYSDGHLIEGASYESICFTACAGGPPFSFRAVRMDRQLCYCQGASCPRRDMHDLFITHCVLSLMMFISRDSHQGNLAPVVSARSD